MPRSDGSQLGWCQCGETAQHLGMLPQERFADQFERGNGETLFLIISPTGQNRILAIDPDGDVFTVNGQWDELRLVDQRESLFHRFLRCFAGR